MLFRWGHAWCGLLSFLLLFVPGAARGQEAPRFAAETLALRQAVRAQASAPLQRPAAPHYDVVALRVAFRPDTSRFTTGDGTFDDALYPGGLTPTMDPYPHDAAYFEAHLAFLEDYVARVSDGRTTVTTHLVPEVVRVSQEMGAYSPTGPDSDSDEELAKLARLVEEAWTRADAVSTFDLSAFDPATTVFVLFHAGVGRDVELIGTTLDKTPQDLPSLFFDEAALRRLLGPVSITFNGMPVTHTLLLPRTETRSGFDFISDEPFLAEFTINGLLASSFFNVLGVPDLFNTATGESAIGPFGLMDPLGIFAFNGLFPPEPSAWTKLYLGWTSAKELRGDGPETVALRHTSDPARSDVARAWISGGEYFLVENRHRDPEGDGLVMRVWRDGAVREVRVANGDEDFNRLDTRGFEGGVVMSVDDYDFAVPGGVDEDGNELNGGILIWHVDERRLAEGMPANRVNADPERRAVDVEEADGAQDIGFPNPGSFGPAFDLGTPFDFFFRDNPVVVVTQTGREIRLYENRFGPDTFPDSRSNEGGPSFITLEDFSAPGVEMSVTYRRAGEAGITPLPKFESKQIGGSRASFTTGGFVKVTDDGAPRLMLYTGNAVPSGGETELNVFDEETGEGRFGFVIGGGQIGSAGLPEGGTAVAYFGSRLSLDLYRDSGTQSVRYENVGVDVADVLPPLVVASRSGQTVFHVRTATEGSSGAAVLELYEDGTSDVLFPESEVPLGLASDGGRLIVVTRSGVRVGTDEVWRVVLTADAEVGQPAFGSDASGLVGVTPLVSEGAIIFLLADGTARLIDVGGELGQTEGTLSRFPVLADLDGDERLDVLTTYDRSLVAFTQAGAMVDGFPIALSAPSVAQPLVAELSESGAWSVVVAATDGYVYAYDLGRGGEQVAGFPLAVGLSVEATPLLHDKKLYAVSREGGLRAWALDNLGDVWWGQLYADAQNRSYVELVADPEPGPEAAGAALLDARETYNWPNPIREGVTHLRFLPSKPCRIRITIIDAAGALIDEIAMDGVPAGVPSEYAWTTDAPSGLYFARITAVADDGETQSRLVKMAIIR